MAEALLLLYLPIQNLNILLANTEKSQNKKILCLFFFTEQSSVEKNLINK
jgi:hypothetical protein